MVDLILSNQTFPSIFSHQFPNLNDALCFKFSKSAFFFATFKAFLDISIPIPIASLYSLSKLKSIQPEPVPKSKILLNFPRDNVCSIKVSVSGLGSKTSDVTKNLLFQKYL